MDDSAPADFPLTYRANHLHRFFQWELERTQSVETLHDPVPQDNPQTSS